MATTSFVLTVSYSQIGVFDSTLAQPFNMWTERHVDQGFAWRHQSVSFRTLVEAGRHLVEVIVTDGEVEPSPEAVRVIQVPFAVPSSGSIEIASIADAFPLELQAGIYALRFEAFRPEEEGLDPRVRFVFIRREDPTFEVMRADAELSLHSELLLTASAA
jgi:hypothetical protein